MVEYYDAPLRVGSPVARLLDYVGRYDNAGDVEGVAIVVQSKGGFHKIWIAQHGNLDWTAMKNAVIDVTTTEPQGVPNV